MGGWNKSMQFKDKIINLAYSTRFMMGNMLQTYFTNLMNNLNA